MTYRPTFRPQFGDPTTPLDAFLCTLESGAMALDFHTRGAIKVWGGQLVPWCGLTAAQISGKAPRQDGGTRTGTSLVNVELAWRHWGQTLSNRTGLRWQNVNEALNAGRAVILQGDYDQLSLASRCRDSFTGDHAVLVLPERNGSRWLVGDPLCAGFRWVPEAELFKYADKLGFGGRLYFAITNSEHAAGPGVPDTATEDKDMVNVKGTGRRLGRAWVSGGGHALFGPTNVTGLHYAQPDGAGPFDIIAGPLRLTNQDGSDFLVDGNAVGEVVLLDAPTFGVAAFGRVVDLRIEWDATGLGIAYNAGIDAALAAIQAIPRRNA